VRIFTGATIVDLDSGEHRPGWSLGVEGGKVVAAGAAEAVAAEAGADAETIDVGAGYLLPGLINCHVHLDLALPGASYIHDETRDARVLRTMLNGERSVAAGVTTVRLTGTKDHVEFTLRDLIEAGQVAGPRIFTAGHGVTSTGGHGHATFVEADGPAEFRKAARAQLTIGADLVKICISGGIAGRHETGRDTQLFADEMAAAIEVAHMWGKHATAHAGPAAGITTAIEQGIDCIEHGYYLDKATTDLMAERGVWLVPTIGVSRCGEFYERIGAPCWMIEKGLASAEDHWQGLVHAIDSGVRLAMGTDMYPHEELDGTTATVCELEWYQQAGLSPLESLRTATVNPAALLRQSGLLGTLAVGAHADLVVVDDDPLVDVAALRGIRFVAKGGVVARDDRSGFSIARPRWAP